MIKRIGKKTEQLQLPNKIVKSGETREASLVLNWNVNLFQVFGMHYLGSAWKVGGVN